MQRYHCLVVPRVSEGGGQYREHGEQGGQPSGTQQHYAEQQHTAERRTRQSRRSRKEARGTAGTSLMQVMNASTSPAAYGSLRSYSHSARTRPARTSRCTCPSHRPSRMGKQNAGRAATHATGHSAARPARRAGGDDACPEREAEEAPEAEGVAAGRRAEGLEQHGKERRIEVGDREAGSGAAAEQPVDALYECWRVDAGSQAHAHSPGGGVEVSEVGEAAPWLDALHRDGGDDGPVDGGNAEKARGQGERARANTAYRISHPESSSIGQTYGRRRGCRPHPTLRHRMPISRARGHIQLARHGTGASGSLVLDKAIEME
jgi:hypothetical protein